MLNTSAHRESIPQEVDAGSEILSGTINEMAYLLLRSLKDLKNQLFLKFLI